MKHNPLPDSRREVVIKRRVFLRAKFFRHLAMYLVVFTALWAVNLWMLREGSFLRPEKWWAFWPTFGWGFGVLTHGISVALSSYTTLPYVSVDWEERRVHADLAAFDAMREK